MPGSRRSTPRQSPSLFSAKLRVQGVALAVGLLLTLAFLCVPALLPFFLALGLAYAFSPMVDALQRRGVPRRWSAAGLLLGLLAALLLFSLYLLPGLVTDAKTFLVCLPDNLAAALARARIFGQSFGVQVPEGQALVDSLRLRLQEVQLSSMGTGVDFARSLFSRLGSVIYVVLNLLLVPVFFFFLLSDLPSIKHHILLLAPTRHQALVASGYAQVDRVFSSYLRGQMILAGILGVALATGLTLLGVKFGLIIGLLAGFLNLIPYIGQITGVTLALIMGLVDFQSWGQLLAIPALFAGMDMLEGSFITPRVVGKRVGLSSVETLLALLLGAELAGLAGLVIVIPLAGAFKLLLLDWVADYKASGLYRRQV